MLIFKYSKKKRNFGGENSNRDKSKIHKRLLLALGIVVTGYFVLLNTVFSENGTNGEDRRRDAPFCESNDECLLYNCTNCGNKYWVNDNESTDCDKEPSVVVGCKCEDGVCKRVIK